MAGNFASFVYKKMARHTIYKTLHLLFEILSCVKPSPMSAAYYRSDGGNFQLVIFYLFVFSAYVYFAGYVPRNNFCFNTE